MMIVALFTLGLFLAGLVAAHRLRAVARRLERVGARPTLQNSLIVGELEHLYWLERLQPVGDREPRDPYAGHELEAAGVEVGESAFELEGAPGLAS